MGRVWAELCNWQCRPFHSWQASAKKNTLVGLMSDSPIMWQDFERKSTLKDLWKHQNSKQLPLICKKARMLSQGGFGFFWTTDHSLNWSRFAKWALTSWTFSSCHLCHVPDRISWNPLSIVQLVFDYWLRNTSFYFVHCCNKISKGLVWICSRL